MVLPGQSTAAIVRLDHIGDLVLTTPMIRALAASGWNVEVIAPPIACLLDGNPDIRAWHDLHAIAPRWPSGWWKLASFLRERRYDVLILPYAHSIPLLLASMASGSRRRIAMWSGIIGRLTGHECVRSGFHEEARPYAQTILRALAPLGIHSDNIHLQLFPTPEEIQAARAALDKRLPPGVRIGIHPVCLGNTCNLPVSEYGKLVRQILSQTDWSVVVTGAANEVEILTVSDFPADSSNSRLWVACGAFDLRGLAALFTQMDCIVIPSTGPLHIAHAVGTRTITPFCPQIPVCSRIWGHEPPLALSIEPAHPPCDARCLHGAHCDFRGTLTATELFNALVQQVNAARSADTA